jgi:hypothetical protein
MQYLMHKETVLDIKLNQIKALQTITITQEIAEGIAKDDFL